MQTYRSNFPVNIVFEGLFWTEQSIDHSKLLIEVTEGLEAEYKAGLKEWMEYFKQMNASFTNLGELISTSNPANHQVLENIHYTVQHIYTQMNHYIGFINVLGENSSAINNNKIATSLIEHIRRESEYYNGLNNAFLIACYQQM
ncbi:hypothetical protein GCM10011351_30520 [Paraliobacillus quinghaiensis]|uniref:DUF2935 domain-containing protein n=1 Tax=Paraliobacillus quinghaiensis TaxID=470815 RepID=A0A917WYP8_9BACI|nr:DUF2935 domain-containing protein [Paraliobacillus quinghaiensis]GGM42382.1 hypothetical protein GCM10011351_30520 [Paraliobacillus quinghaiensis]